MNGARHESGLTIFTRFVLVCASEKILKDLMTEEDAKDLLWSLREKIKPDQILLALCFRKPVRTLWESAKKTGCDIWSRDNVLDFCRKHNHKESPVIKGRVTSSDDKDIIIYETENGRHHSLNWYELETNPGDEVLVHRDIVFYCAKPDAS